MSAHFGKQIINSVLKTMRVTFSTEQVSAAAGGKANTAMQCQKTKFGKGMRDSVGTGTGI